jgi:hypothetical protein
LLFEIHKHLGLIPPKLFSEMSLSVERHKQALAAVGKLHVTIDHLKALSFRSSGQDERHRMNHAIEMLRRFGPAYVKLGKTVLYDRTDLVAFESVDLGS